MHALNPTSNWDLSRRNFITEAKQACARVIRIREHFEGASDPLYWYDNMLLCLF